MNRGMKTYHADVVSWSKHHIFHFEAKDKNRAYIRAITISGSEALGKFDFVRLWGEGKLLWTADEGWLPEHEAF